MEIIFFHFLGQQSTAASGSSFFFNWNIFFSQSFIPASGNEFFYLLETVFFYSKHFSANGILLKFEGSQILKTNHIPASGHHFFSDFFRYFLKWKPCFRIVKVYFSISFIRLVQNEFSAYGNSIFLVRAILLLLGIIDEIKR